MGSSETKWGRYDDFVAELSRHLGDVAPAPAKSVGERIKELREARGVSREALAADIEIGLETLARIESNEISPPLGTVMKLARYLGAEAGSLLGGPGDKAYSIVRSDERRPVERVASESSRRKSYSYMTLASDVKGRHMETFLVKLEPQDSQQELSSHQGEEFLFVLNGSMSVRIGDAREVVEAGDSIYYLSSVPHLVASAGEEPALVLAVIYSGN